MRTYIRFSEDHSVAIQEDLAEAKALINATEETDVPLFDAAQSSLSRPSTPLQSQRRPTRIELV